MSLPDYKLQHLISKQGVCKNMSVYIMKVLLCLSPLMFCTAMLSVCAIQATSSTSYSKQNVCKTYMCTLHLIVLYKPVCTGIQVTACRCAVQLKQSRWVRQSTLAQQTPTNSLKLPHMCVLCSLIQTCIINTSSLILYTLFLCFLLYV